MKHSQIFSFLLVPPEKPKIYEERGQEVRLKLGPYKIGDTILLKCVASGGNKYLIYIGMSVIKMEYTIQRI